jgi:hypothetical protein
MGARKTAAQIRTHRGKGSRIVNNLFHKQNVTDQDLACLRGNIFNLLVRCSLSPYLLFLALVSVPWMLHLGSVPTVPNVYRPVDGQLNESIPFLM